jgi:hypothetical protein
LPKDGAKTGSRGCLKLWCATRRVRRGVEAVFLTNIARNPLKRLDSEK